jgi:hypothetical protein
VDEPVYDDAGRHWVGEHLGPVRKGQVRRYSDACAFITLCDDLVKQIQCCPVKSMVSSEKASVYNGLRPIWRAVDLK